MHDPEDIVEFGGVQMTGPSGNAGAGGVPRRKFLSVWYRCCHTYGRMTRNRQQTAYEGRCPKCGAKVRAMIGPGGTSQSMFVAE